jgi:UDP-N-acetylglucosamine:LPS N-acetylglucosamine transferase
MCRARNVAGALELGDAGQKLKPNDRVLFIIGRGGGGHKAAARAVAASMKDSPVEIETIDAGYVIEGIMCNRPPRTSGFDMDELYNIFMRHGLHGLTGFMGILARMLAVVGRPKIVHGLAKQWKTRPPALVVSFIPFFNGVFREALQMANPRATMLTCVTDFASSREHYWIDDFCTKTASKHVIVAGTPKLVKQCADQGYPTAQVLRTSGMVVHPSFHANAPVAAAGGDTPSSPVPAAARRALVCFGGYPPMRVERIVNELVKIDPTLEVIVMCGGNVELLRRLTERGGCIAEPMASAERVGELMRWASFVVGKPGPGVVTEACACGTALVTERHAVMPQEEDVLAWIEESGCGVVLDNLCAPPNDLTSRVMRCVPKAIEQMHSNRAVFEVAELCNALVAEARSLPEESASRNEGEDVSVAKPAAKAPPTTMTSGHRRTPSTSTAFDIESGTGSSGSI